VDYAFDALFLDPPFANVGVAELAAATRALMGAAPRPLYVGYNAKRAAELEAAFADFALKNTGEALTYASGVMAGDITLFSNV
jgi:16S rRNA G966 N2-methylase RsmD